MTKEEIQAIANLRRAITKAGKLGIRLAGMDGALLFATKSAFKVGESRSRIEESKGRTVYSSVAMAVQHGDIDGCGTLDNRVYDDSGGW